jgi:O-antigen/teichoic acid export membrane protein
MDEKKKGKRLVNWDRILPILLSAISSIFSILTSFLIAKPLGSDLYGTIQYYLGLISTISILLSFGIDYVLIKSSQFSKDPKAFFSKYIFLFDLVSLFGLSIFFLISYFGLAGVAGNAWLIIWISLSGYFTAYSLVFGGFLLGTGKATLSTFLSSFLPKLILFVGSLSILYFGGSELLVNWYVILYLLAYAVSVVPFSLSKIKKTPFKFSKSEVLTVISFFLLSVTQSLNKSLSKVIQGQYDAYQTTQGHSYTGILGLSLQIFTLANLFGSTVTSLAQPLFASYFEGKDEKGLIDTYRQVLRINSYIAIPFCLALMLETSSVLRLFGDSFSTMESVYFFVLIGIATLLSTVCGPCGTMLTYAGHEKIQIINGLIYIGLFVGLSLLFETITIYGIPISYLASTVVVEVAKLVELAIFYKTIPIDWKTLLVLFALSIIVTIIFFPLRYISNLYVWIGTNAVLGLGVIVGCFFLTPFKSDRTFFQKRTPSKEINTEEEHGHNV